VLSESIRALVHKIIIKRRKSIEEDVENKIKMIK
jgi:hypothetical protein